MVQVIGPSPLAMQKGQIGEAIGGGLAKRLGLMEAEQSFQQAQGDPMKLATAMARLMSVSPELARGAGPMYEAMLRQTQKGAIERAAGGQGFGPTEQGYAPTGPGGRPLERGEQPSRLEQALFREGAAPTDQQPLGREPIPVRETTQGLQETGVAAPETLPVPFWTPQQRFQRIRDYQNYGFLPEKAEQLAARDEELYVKNPEQYQKRQDAIEQKRLQARAELTRQLETKTQKKDAELFKDIPGEYLIGIEKGMEKDIRENPTRPLAQIADDWSTRALDLAKAKSQYKQYEQTAGIENLLPGTKGLDKLEAYGNIFRKAGNEEEYYNMLRGSEKDVLDEKGNVIGKQKVGFGLSPQGAARIAYGIRPELETAIKKNVVPMTPKTIMDPGKEAVDFASTIGPKIHPDDSLLSIAWEARKRNRMFDEKAFFKHMNDNAKAYGLNARQEREVAEGASRIRPYWADILIFPWLGK